jgi:hypothetical protein
MFWNCTNLTSVIIPDTVTNIEDGAFENCTSLTKVTIPNGVTNIGVEAFGGCTSLTSVIIPESITSIGGGAFDGTSLTSVTIPNSVTNIGLHAFGSCLNLTAITVGTSNSVYSDADGVLFNQSLTTLVEYPGGIAGSYIVPNSVTSIGSFAFYYCNNLTSVTIANNVTNIGDYAFVGCSNLTSVTIPNSVTTIRDYAFTECSSLTSVTIPNGVAGIAVGTFAFCASLTNVTIPISVTSIGEAAFYGCSSLTGVYSKGNAPFLSNGDVFTGDTNTTVYYLPGTTGWGTSFGACVTMLWKPQVQTGDSSFGVRTNRFGFNIAWASGMQVLVEAASDLMNPVWQPLQTNTLANDSIYFSDPRWTNYPSRFYRVRWP